MVVEKNQDILLSCIDLSNEAFGVCKYNGFPIFVENLLPFEQAIVKIIKVTKKFAIGKIVKLEKISKDRVEVLDKKGTWVGTMPLQHMCYDAQLAFKQKWVEKCFSRYQQNDVVVSAVIPSCKVLQYRNKAQIPVRSINGEVVVGFFRKKTHTLIPMTDFMIQEPILDEVIAYLKQLVIDFHIKPYDEETHTGVIRHFVVRVGVATGQIQVVLVTNQKVSISAAFVQQLCQKFPHIVSVVQNINSQKTNVILGDEQQLLYGKLFIEDVLWDKKFYIGAKSFYQVNPKQTENLYRIAISLLKVSANDIVIDAYCGIGTISLCIAPYVKHVYGMEIVDEAIEMANENARINHCDNVTFKAGDASVILREWEYLKVSGMIVDPPRKGIEKSFIDTLAKMNIPKLVYVSCNPETLARDALLLKEKGYVLCSVQPVDMFPHTLHVETIALIQKVNT